MGIMGMVTMDVDTEEVMDMVTMGTGIMDITHTIMGMDMATMVMGIVEVEEEVIMIKQ